MTMPGLFLLECRVRIVVAGLLFAFLASPGFAQSVASPPPLPVTASSVPMVWHADVLSSAAVLSLTEADHAVRWLLPAAARDTGATSKLIRALEVVGFDIPVAVFFVSLNHDLGHTVRASELGTPAHVRLVGSPWSLHPFYLWSETYPRWWGPALFDLGMESSGFEASWLLKDRTEERVLRHGSVPFGEAVTLLVAAMDTPLYAAARLGPARDVGSGGPQGDMVNYVYQLQEERWMAGGRGDDYDLRAAIRGKSFLNLIDLSLWSDVASVGAWLTRGDESRPLSWLRIGSIGLIPSMRYSLTPIGPEFSVRSHFRKGQALGSAYVRWSERIGNAKQNGAGVTYSAPVFRGLESTIRFDAWSHTLRGSGVRGEISVAKRGWPNRYVGVSATVGAKSSGYLAGYPLARSTYGAVGLNIAVR